MRLECILIDFKRIKIDFDLILKFLKNVFE